MALTEQDKAEILRGIVSKATKSETGSEMTRRIVESRRAQKAPLGFFAETAQDIGQTLGGVAQEVADTAADVGAIAKDEDTGFIRKAFQGAGRIAGGISGAIGEGMKGLVKTVLPTGMEQGVRSGVQAFGGAIAEVPAVQNLVANYQSLPEDRKRDVDALMGFSQLALDIAGAGVGKKAVTAAAPVVKSAAARTAETVGSTLTRAKGAFASPEPSFARSVGQVIGGKGTRREAMKAAAAFKTVDTNGVRSFAELGQRMTTKGDELLKVVDADLARDVVPKKLRTLTKAVSAGGKTVRANYVRTALKHLDEVARKTGDIDALARIRDLTQRANKVGLTAKELNDLARSYGAEFGGKAFDKLGQPLTSVNSRLYENVRKGLKSTARGFVKGNAAKQADEAYSAILSTKELVQKNADAVAKMLAKIEERGLFEKLGHHLFKYADMVSQGFIRGVVGGALPRGVGNKMLNILDAEDLLARNLKVIRKALAESDDKAIEALLKELSTAAK